MIYNVKYATDPILAVHGDAIDLWLHFEEYNSLTEAWDDMDVEVLDLEMKVWNKHGTEIASWSTATGELIAYPDGILNIVADAFTDASCCGSFDAHLYSITPQRTLWKGIIKVV